MDRLETCKAGSREGHGWHARQISALYIAFGYGLRVLGKTKSIMANAEIEKTIVNTGESSAAKEGKRPVEIYKSVFKRYCNARFAVGVSSNAMSRQSGFQPSTSDSASNSIVRLTLPA